MARTADANPDIGGAKSAPWGQERRLEFIDFRLQWEGRVNRSVRFKEDFKRYNFEAGSVQQEADSRLPIQ